MNLEKNAGMYFSSYFYFHQDDDFEKSKEAYLTNTYPVENDCSNGEMGSSLSYFCDAKLIAYYNLKKCIFCEKSGNKIYIPKILYITKIN